MMTLLVEYIVHASKECVDGVMGQYHNYNI